MRKKKKEGRALTVWMACQEDQLHLLQLWILKFCINLF